MDTTVRTPNSFLASNDPTPRAGSYPAWMIKAMEEYAQQKVDLSMKRIEELEAVLIGCKTTLKNMNDLYDSTYGNATVEMVDKVLNHEHTR